MTRQQKSRFLISSFLRLVVLAGMIALPATAHARSSAFSVQGIKVDITADSAAAAREKAFNQAQEKAFAKLAERLLSAQEKENLSIPESQIISGFVQDFEITNERLSSVRYAATYNFRFKNEAVRNYFSGQGLSYTDVASRPVLVLPYYQRGAQAILWGDSNPWLTAWNRQNSTSQGLVPVVVPIGDLSDVSDMGDNAALTYDQRALDQMISRYRAGEALIAIATPHWQGISGAQPQLEPDRLEIALYQTANGPQYSQTLTVNPRDVRNGENLFDAAARKIRETLQSDWRTKTLVSAAQGNELAVRVRYNTLEEWAETQKVLRRVQGVQTVDILSLSPAEAHLRLIFQGSEDRLRLALGQADMTLSTPRISFTETGSMGFNHNARQNASPLVYDIYLNKYRPAPSRDQNRHDQNNHQWRHR